jgi:hypothetical protein
MRILDHNIGSVYIADERGYPVHRPELQSVTFIDEIGSAHTVHAHRDADYDDPSAIVAAWRDGTLTADVPEVQHESSRPDQPKSRFF